MTRYAAETSVSQDRSRAEIEATLKRYGATSFMYASEPTAAMIGFRISDRMVKFVLPMPDPKSREFTHHSRGQRTPDAALKAWEQAGRQRWRALALVIKAKLEAVAAGITTIEDEFLAHTVLPDGSTVGQFMQPQLAIAYEQGSMPTTLLLGGPA
ncbi:hypothetical protein [Brevundimonas naejangsanensis]|uniref:hypothetical protein n=1 Tax=Brevundimonas naejangsanensis TaxID=588932 RepID=UPI0003F82B88|nr:hypothetical protein [Brevundimonas naejangsanensis]